MSFSLHRYSFVGNLTRDPELSISRSGRQMGKISVAVNETFKTKTGYQNKVHYFLVTIFDEFILKRLGKHQKGDLVYTEGDIVPNTYVNSAGNKVYGMSFVAKTLMGPGLKNRVLKELENVYEKEQQEYREKKKRTGPDVAKEVSAEEVEEIFNDIDV